MKVIKPLKPYAYYIYSTLGILLYLSLCYALQQQTQYAQGQYLQYLRTQQAFKITRHIKTQSAPQNASSIVKYLHKFHVPLDAMYVKALKTGTWRLQIYDVPFKTLLRACLHYTHDYAATITTLHLSANQAGRVNATIIFYTQNEKSLT